MRRWWGIGLFGCAIAAACSSFTGNPATESGDAGADANTATADGGRTEIPDAAAPDALVLPEPVEAGSLMPHCPAPVGLAAGFKSIHLSSPPDGTVEFPFQIATDTKLVFWAAQVSGGTDDAYDGHGSGYIYRISKTDQSGTPDRIIDTLRRREPRALRL